MAFSILQACTFPSAALACASDSWWLSLSSTSLFLQTLYFANALSSLDSTCARVRLVDFFSPSCFLSRRILRAPTLHFLSLRLIRVHSKIVRRASCRAGDHRRPPIFSFRHRLAAFFIPRSRSWSSDSYSLASFILRGWPGVHACLNFLSRV